MQLREYLSHTHYKWHDWEKKLSIKYINRNEKNIGTDIAKYVSMWNGNMIVTQ